ncbi:MAG: hypothetical protein M3072_11315 [Candidatus Dormibacteraeota bacterium]|nr:hypothetical protein [Candidatus Dormibacteraeota bacterium]
MTDGTQHIPPELRILDGLEVALRGLQANLQRATPVIERLQQQHSELTAILFSQLEDCEPEEAIAAVLAFKAAIERGQQA